MKTKRIKATQKRNEGMTRKDISYESIVGIGLDLIQEQTNFLWECNDDSDRARVAYDISGIVDLLSALNKATKDTQNGDDE